VRASRVDVCVCVCVCVEAHAQLLNAEQPIAVGGPKRVRSTAP